ncbi:MAG: peptidylprolyl isomerase [Bacteroides sp.]|nr:peptidylprolyl isomerase [Eubacterium sp.]MCM1417156.1 peptidylprolyl isomerase [Roseburia sp.]MCM1461223.1 peptidylprolyl isomerase [Bacteroides sp.]
MKTIKKIAAWIAAGCLLFSAAGCGEEAPTGNIGDVTLNTGDVYAVIHIMDYGDITAKLFPDIAPESVERFTTFAERGYYEMKTIHRVINNYTIQGGSLSGDGSDGDVPDAEYVPVEVSDSARHFYGALCFANNSKGSFAQFYIVNQDTPQDINAVIEKLSEQLADQAFTDRLLPEDKEYYDNYLAKLKAFSPEVIEKYASVGGLYQLDGEATVFGQVIDGFDVLEAISACEVVTGNEIDDRQGIFSKPINSIVIEKIEIIRIEPEETTTSETDKKGNKKTEETTPEVIAETIPTTTATETTPETTEHTLDTLITFE